MLSIYYKIREICFIDKQSARNISHAGYQRLPPFICSREDNSAYRVSAYYTLRRKPDYSQQLLAINNPRN